jgi:hypothetical protein
MSTTGKEHGSLVGEVVIERTAGDARRGDDVGSSHTGVSACPEQTDRNAHQGGAGAEGSLGIRHHPRIPDGLQPVGAG